MRQQVTLVVAAARNGVIGVDGRLPWHLPADLKRFKALTMGKPMIMGRKTFDSLPGLLAGRRHIVLTRDAAWRADGAEPVRDLAQALAAAGPDSAAVEAMVIGGAEIFALALPLATRIELTEVDADIPGDTHLPPLGAGWRETAREAHAPSADRPGYAFVTLERTL